MKNHIIVLLAMAAMAFRTGTSLAAGGDDLVTAVGVSTRKRLPSSSTAEWTLSARMLREGERQE